jgi:chromodomain-helicase-DNA-binding protein 4
MDDELGEDVQSILTFGAQQLFQDENADRGITCKWMCCLRFLLTLTVTVDSEADVQSLIEKTEKEGDQPEETGQNQNSAFSFAKIWTAEKDALTEMSDVTLEHAGEVDDSWGQVLAKLEAERGKVRAQEVTGRGAKRKAAPSFLPKVSVCFLRLVTGLTGGIAKP